MRLKMFKTSIPVILSLVMFSMLILTQDGHAQGSAAGKVVFAGWRRGYGKLVIIDQGKGWQSGYGHLSEIKVRNGQKVTAGTLLGRVGNTGLTTGPHLHYEVRYLNVAYDPLRL